MFAALALTVHALNVARIRNTGPGRVGLILTAHFIASILGKYHRWVDINIHFADDKMKMEQDLWLNAMVTTGEPADTQ